MVSTLSNKELQLVSTVDFSNVNKGKQNIYLFSKNISNSYIRTSLFFSLTDIHVAFALIKVVAVVANMNTLENLYSSVSGSFSSK